MAATRDHGARAHWPPDDVVYAEGDPIFLDTVGAADGDFAYLWVDETGDAVDV